MHSVSCEYLSTEKEQRCWNLKIKNNYHQPEPEPPDTHTRSSVLGVTAVNTFTVQTKMLVNDRVLAHAYQIIIVSGK